MQNLICKIYQLIRWHHKLWDLVRCMLKHPSRLSRQIFPSVLDEWQIPCSHENFQSNSQNSPWCCCPTQPCTWQLVTSIKAKEDINLYIQLLCTIRKITNYKWLGVFWSIYLTRSMRFIGLSKKRPLWSKAKCRVFEKTLKILRSGDAWPRLCFWGGGRVICSCVSVSSDFISHDRYVVWGSFVKP